MEQKTWPWRKRSSEKTIIANRKPDFDFKGKVEEVFLPKENEAVLQESLKILNEKLASLAAECDDKEALLKDHAERAREAATGKEKAEMEMLLLKKQLDEALQQKCAVNDRLGNLNAALKDCMQQLSSVREEQDQRVQAAIEKTSKEFEKAHKKLDDNIAETSKKLATLTVENSHLIKALQVKEKLIEDLSARRSQVEAEFDALMSRLDAVEKENSFLRYEYRMLEKDLDIRSEEMEFTRRSADASEKRYLESLNKMKKLETECQRLRVLVRKRLPAPALLSTMRAEVEMQERFQMQTRRKHLNPVPGGLVVREPARENLDISSKRISFLVERLQNVEQENKVLKDLLTMKQSDISDSPGCTQIVPRSTHAEARLGVYGKAASGGNICNESEKLERNESEKLEHNMLGTSDMSLMDDFVEMEKLAIVALDVPHESGNASSDRHQTFPDSFLKEIRHERLESTGMELVPVEKEPSELSQQLQMSDSNSKRPFEWLQIVLKTLMEQVHVSAKSIDELLEEIKIALHAETYDCGSSTHSGTELLPVSGFLTWKSPLTSPSVGSSRGIPDICSSLEETNHELVLSVSAYIHKIIELVRRFCLEQENQLERDRGDSKINHLATAENHALHIFGWKADGLAKVLHQFIVTCNHLLEGNASFEKFVAELLSALEWIMNQCIIMNDLSYIEKHLCHKAMGTATELGSLQNLLSEMEKIHSVLQLENKGLKNELSSLKSFQRSLELSLQSARDKSEALSSELEKSQQSITSLQTELETLSESKRMIEDQFENQKLINEELDTQFTIAKVRLNEVSQKLSSLEVELENKSHSCEELEGTCLELQLQLESFARKDIVKNGDIDQDQNLLQTGWEIKAASMKLAECEATILNLGNQLKSLTPPNEASYANKVFTNPIKSNKKLNQHLSLLDRILSEDSSEPSRGKELISNQTHRKSLHQTNGNRVSGVQQGASGGDLSQKNSATMTSRTGALVILPSKKRARGTGFLRRLLLWKKRGTNKKTPFPFAA